MKNLSVNESSIHALYGTGVPFGTDSGSGSSTLSGADSGSGSSTLYGAGTGTESGASIATSGSLTLMQKLGIFMQYSVFLLFTLLSTYLLIIAGMSTSTTNNQEHTTITSDNIFINLLVPLILILCIVLINKLDPVKHLISKVNSSDRLALICRLFLYMIILLSGTYFVVTLQKTPEVDQLSICKAAQNILAGNYSDFEPGGYAERYPQQLGIILLLLPMSAVFQENLYLSMQMLNVISLVFMFGAFAKIAKRLGNTNMTSIMMILGCMMFIPALLYTTFVYGTLIGLALAVNAALMAWDYISYGRPLRLFMTILLMLLSVIIKSNYLIFAIGLFLWTFISFFTRPSRRKVLLMITLCIITLQGSLVKTSLSAITGHSIGRGMSSWSWVAMGLQENDNLFDGWWNRYIIKTYRAADYDHDAQEATAKQYIAERLEEFKSDPTAALNFFIQKNASQWNNPSFQGFWINNRMSSRGDYPAFLSWVLDSGSSMIEGYLNYFMFAVLSGVFIYMVSLIQSDNKLEANLSLVFQMVIIGGFIFHTVWEAKAQYTFAYFLMMIPLGIVGYSRIPGLMLAAQVLKQTEPAESTESSPAPLPQKKHKTSRSSYTLLSGLALLICILFINYSGIKTLNNIFLVNVSAGTTQGKAAPAKGQRNAESQVNDKIKTSSPDYSNSSSTEDSNSKTEKTQK